MVRTEGALAPLRGMNVVALGAGPAHAVYFTSYEMTKKFFGNLGNKTLSGNVAVGKKNFGVFLLCTQTNH